MALSPRDPHSYARPELAVVTDIHLELYVDFDEKILTGKAVLTIKKEPSTTEVILDNYGLVILTVTDFFTGSHLEYHMGYDNVFGNKFIIQLPQPIEDNGNTCTIQIRYETSRTSPALYWLTPEQTADGKYPFLLSNSKLIFARAMFPCQDTPSVKFTYSAKISVPIPFTVLTSAVLVNRSKLETLHRFVYKYRQKTPLPSYAVTIVVGVLKYAKLYREIGLWTEEKYFRFRIRKSFSLSILMMSTARELCGPFRWHKYDICVLPPSVSHLEIECPCVAFVSPTLLGGDVSLISSIARNMSRCWTGYSVTCANYEHLWLNKSFSTFIQRKILGTVIHEEMSLFLEIKGFIDQTDTIKNFGNSRMKSLLPCLIGLLPNEATKYVVYEKGCILLESLQFILGGRRVFEPFLKSYLNTFALDSIDTYIMLQYLHDYFSERQEVLKSFDWKTWLHAESFTINPPRSLLGNVCFDLAEKWINWDSDTPPCFTAADIQNFYDLQKIIFLNYLHASHKVLSKQTIKLMSRLYQFSDKNSEIWFAWLRLCIKSRRSKMITHALNFAIQFCSPKYACPIFRDLYEWIDARPIAITEYVNKKRLIPDETRNELELILHLNMDANDPINIGSNN